MVELFRKQEVLSASTRSPFVLTQDGQEKTLADDDKISLNPGTQVPEDDKIQSFAVCPNGHNLSLMIRWESGNFVNSKWGLINSDSFGSSEGKKKFGVGLRPVAFTSRDGRSYIKGSSMYFDQQETRLHGDNWILEYRPL